MLAPLIQHIAARRLKRCQLWPTNGEGLVSSGMAVESLPDARRCCARVHSGQVCNLVLPLGPKLTLGSPNNTVEIDARDPESVMQLWNRLCAGSHAKHHYGPHELQNIGESTMMAASGDGPAFEKGHADGEWRSCH